VVVRITPFLPIGVIFPAPLFLCSFSENSGGKGELRGRRLSSLNLFSTYHPVWGLEKSS
jgi:hypothetical protein